MKPVGLVQQFINNSSREEDIILDLFGGGGSTLIAAQKLNRTAHLMELDPKYIDVIIRRWQDYTGLEAKLESTGKSYNDKYLGERSTEE
jgi:DNA modification methylase